MDFTDHDWTFILSDVCPMVSNILNAVINDLTAVPDAAKFLLDYILFMTYLLRSDREFRSTATLLDLLMRTLNHDPMTSTTQDRRFFTKYGVTGNETIPNGNTGKYAIRPKATGVGDSFKVTSAYLIQFINTFGDNGGFDAMAKRIALEGDLAIPFIQYGFFATILVGIDHLLDSKISKKFIPSMKWDVPSILARIRSMTDDELKSVSRDMLQVMVQKLIQLLCANKEVKTKPNEAADKIQLALCDRLLHSTILEKRINGILALLDIVKALKLKSSGASLNPTEKTEVLECHTTPKTFLDWVDKNGIVQLILSLDSHEEILKRSPVILKYLAAHNALSVEPIFHLFDSVLTSGTTHDAFVRIVYDLVADVSPDLNDATLDQLIRRLKEIPKVRYTPVFLRFLCKLAQSCSRVTPARAFPLLQIFWDLVSAPDSDTEVALECGQQAIEILGELFVLRQFDHQRIPHIERAMKALNLPTTPVLKMLRFLTNTLHTFPPQSDPSQWNQSTLITALDNKLNLTRIYFDEIQRYHSAASQIFETIPADERSQSNPITTGSSTHSVNIQARLDFLQFCLDRCKQFPLHPNQIDILWRVLYSAALTPNDSVMLFRWLQLLIDDGSEVGTMTRRRAYSPLSEDVLKHTFNLLMNDLDFEKLSIDAYRCIELYFCYLNYLLGHLAYPAKKHMQVISPHHLVGIGRVWKLIGSNSEKRIGMTARSFLVNLYTKLETKAVKRRNDAYLLFLDRCLTELTDLKKLIETQPENVATYTRMAVQYLLVLDIFLNSCDKIQLALMGQPGTNGNGNGNGGSNGPRPTDDVVMTDAMRTSLDPEGNFHRFTLSNSNEHFSRLFDLLNLGGEISTRVWQLLTKLPTNQELEQKIVSIASHNGSTASMGERPSPSSASAHNLEIDWANLLASNSITKMLYILQLIQAHLRRGTPSSQLDAVAAAAAAKSVHSWSQVFLLRGGFEFVYKFTLGLEIERMFTESVMSQQCLASLIKLLNTFMAFTPGSEPAKLTDKIIQYDSFIQMLLNIIKRTVEIQVGDATSNGSATSSSSSSSTNESAAPTDPDSTFRLGGLLRNTYQLLAYCLTRHNEYLSKVAEYAQWETILQLGLQHDITQIREQTAEGVEILCSDSNLIVHENVPTASSPTSDPIPTTPIPIAFTTLFMPKLLNLLHRIETRSTRCLSYFELTRKLLAITCQLKIPLDTSALVAYLIERVTAHPIMESRSSDRDLVLPGLFQLLNELFRHQPQLKFDAPQAQPLVRELVDALFRLPTTSRVDLQDANARALSPPKCKSYHSRRSAFDLLEVLVSESGNNLHTLIQSLLPLHQVTHSNGRNLDDWDFESGRDEKSDCGYVGLRNAGSICYLNSTVQQFFMIPEFRKALFMAESNNKDEPPTSSVLYQLQYIMAFLQESEKQAFDPMGLCNSFVDFDGNPINGQSWRI